MSFHIAISVPTLWQVKVPNRMGVMLWLVVVENYLHPLMRGEAGYTLTVCAVLTLSPSLTFALPHRAFTLVYFTTFHLLHTSSSLL